MQVLGKRWAHDLRSVLSGLGDGFLPSSVLVEGVSDLFRGHPSVVGFVARLSLHLLSP